MLHRPNDPYGHILRYEPGDLVRYTYKDKSRGTGYGRLVLWELGDALVDQVEPELGLVSVELQDII